MITFVFYKVIPALIAILFLIRLYFYYKDVDADKQGNNKLNLAPEKILKRFYQPINYQAPQTLKEKINRAWFKSSFIIIPISLLIWITIVYEIFSRSNLIFFPSVMSVLLLLPVSVFGLICYVIVMFVVMIFHKK